MQPDPASLIPAHLQVPTRTHGQEKLRPPATRRPIAQLRLAAKLDDPDQTIACGNLTLAPNSNVRWLAFHHRSACRHGSPHPVQRVTVSRARLLFGMPTLSFAERPGAPVDVMRIPASDPSIKTVAERLMAALSRGAMAADGPEGFSTCRFPQAYLGFAARSMEALFMLATRQQAIGRTLLCRGCGRDIDVARLFAVVAGNASGLAACPVCGRVQRWALGEAVPTRFTRHVPIGFIRRFCRAIEKQLPLQATGPATYCGTRPFCPARDWPNLPDARTRRLDLLVHEFCCALSGEQQLVYLPRSARIEAAPGQRLAAGQVWCRVLTSPPDGAWRSLPRPLQYTAAERVLGGDVLTDHLKRIWFDHEGITCAEVGEHQRLWPADLVAFAAGGPLRPLGLYWDFTAAQTYFDGTITRVALFPHIRFGADVLRRATLPGDVALDAELGRPRQAFASRRRLTAKNPQVRVAQPSLPRRLAS
jgi:hypothetical protein